MMTHYSFPITYFISVRNSLVIYCTHLVTFVNSTLIYFVLSCFIFQFCLTNAEGTSYLHVGAIIWLKLTSYFSHDQSRCSVHLIWKVSVLLLVNGFKTICVFCFGYQITFLQCTLICAWYEIQQINVCLYSMWNSQKLETQTCIKHLRQTEFAQLDGQ